MSTKSSLKGCYHTACLHIYTGKPSLRTIRDTALVEVAIDYFTYKQIMDKEIEGSSLYLAFHLFQGWFLIKVSLDDVSTEAIWGANTSSGGGQVTFASQCWNCRVVKWIDDCKLLWKYTMLNKRHELLLFNILRRQTCLQTEGLQKMDYI